MQSLKKNRLTRPKLLLFLSGMLWGQMLLAQSVLAEGAWRKVGVTKSGVYKLDHAFFTRMGMPASADPETIKVHGPGFTGMLPQANAVARAFDPVEIPVHREGAADGRLDPVDFVLFYAPGPDKLEMDSSGLARHEKNIFADTAWYLVTFGGTKGQTVPSLPAPTDGIGAKTTFRSFVVHEQDLMNQLKSGREWLGEEFGNNQRQRTFSVPLDGQTDSVLLMLRVVAETLRPATFDVFGNDQLLGSMNMDTVTNGAYDTKGIPHSVVYRSATSGTEQFNLRFHYNYPGGFTSRVLLGKFIVGYDRKVSFGSAQSELFVIAGANDLFSITEAGAGSRVWDVTDVYAPKACGLLLQNGAGVFTVSGGIRHLVAFDASSPPAPIDGGTVTNQNIKSLAGNNGIIVTAPAFLAEANRLAQFHRLQGLSVGVATTTQIYQEFSSGQQDITAIRDFLKYCYDHGGLQYALLFGDGSYDYKSRVFGNTNFVPTYQSYESFHPILSYASDDYFGFMEAHEGTWFEGRRRPNSSSFLEQPVNHTLDIGVGRLPAKTAAEARQTVDKIIRYKTSRQALGLWRTQVAYLADDGDFGTHMDHPEELFNIFQSGHPEYAAKKLYLDAFEQIPGGAYETSPDLRRELQSVIKDGVLVLNYTGHGGPRELMDERVVDHEFIDQMTNRHWLPLIVTATCDFGKFDDPAPQEFSGAEKLILHPNGGGIALLTTTRPVYAHTNLPLNRAFHQHVFRRINGELPRLGDVIRQTKNNSLEGVYNRNFTLLGDPMLVLNYPQYAVQFDQLEAQMDTLSALEAYHLTGSIVDNNGILGDFEGVGTLTVWDVPEQKVTRGNQNSPFQYEDQANALFRGEVTVSGGRFEARFVMPKNSSYKFESGRISFYAQSHEDMRDAAGATSNFVIGGTAAEMSNDRTVPTVQLFLNDSSFVNGGTVGPSSLFIARIFDVSGVNISNNGFNQGMVLVLNEQTIRLNDYYTADRDTYQSGTVVFPLQNLQPGNYTATLKVADTHNNSTSAAVQFRVSDQPQLRLFNAGNYPNPASVSWDGRTTFSFEHDRESEELQVEIMVYNLQGTQVNHQRYRIDSSPRLVDGLEWPLSNFQGSPLEKGIYLYRMKVTSTLDGANNEVVRRMVIVN